MRLYVFGLHDVLPENLSVSCLVVKQGVSFVGTRARGLEMGACAMRSDTEEKERREIWFAVKMAVRAYAEDPSELNTVGVRKVLLRLRTVRERALAARIPELLDAREHQDKVRTSA